MTIIQRSNRCIRRGCTRRGRRRRRTRTRWLRRIGQLKLLCRCGVVTANGRVTRASRALRLPPVVIVFRRDLKNVADLKLEARLRARYEIVVGRIVHE